ncbi:MAG: ankyrin repeat domain-containing protein [Candidatus Thiodiazotropha sp.]
MSMVKKAALAGVAAFFLLYAINFFATHFYASRILGQSKESISLASAFALISSIKTSVTEYYAMTGRLPESNTDLGVGYPRSISDSVVDSVTIGPEGRIDISLKGVGDNAHIYLISSANTNSRGPSLIWHCYAKGVKQASLNTIHSPSCILLSKDDPPLSTQLQRQAHKPTVEAIVKAIHEKRNGLVTKLIKQKVDVNGRTEKGESPLRVAIEHADNYVVQQLIIAGAKVNEAIKDEKGKTLLMLATENRRHGELKVRELLNAGAYIEARDNSKKTSLIHAAINNDTKALRVLLEFGANTRAVDRKGQTAASYAALLHGKNSKIYRKLSAKREKPKDFIYRLPE